MRIARMLDPVALEGAEIVGITELGTDGFEDRPVALFAFGSDLARR